MIPYHWLGPDAERIAQEHAIEEARIEAERMRHLVEDCPE